MPYRGSGKHHRSVVFCAALLTLSGWGLAQTQTDAPSVQTVRPLALNQIHYRLRAGDRITIDTSAEALDFIRSARTRSVTAGQVEGKGLAFGLSRAGDEAFLAASLRMKPGKYDVTVSVTSQSGEVRAAAINVTLDPLQPVPSGYSQPPVVLLNGWQMTCPSDGEADTFGSLGPDLHSLYGVPIVYFFDNCVEDDDGTIEDLGTIALSEVLGLIRYDTGAQVPQIDLVAHSMGGLIVRAYLAGLQTDGTLSPPSTFPVRKFVEIATPNFGSFLARTDPVPDVQVNEMKLGSTFLWSLATWNQGRDDLRGVDALAIIGRKGYQATFSYSPPAGASDGVVSLSSASLGFARDPSRTLILNYCHVDFKLYDVVPLTPDCNGSGIAKAPETEAIVGYFLDDNPQWQSVPATTPLQDPFLSIYGGIVLLDQTNTDQSLDLNNLYFVSSAVPLTDGAAPTYVWNEFINGTGDFFEAGTPLCGPYTEPVGYFSAVRCKASPAISSIGPPSPNASGLIVQSGTTITINGRGFGSQQCSTCGVSVYPNLPLTVSTWSDQAITAFLPPFSSAVAIGLTVQTATGLDYITFMVAPAVLPPTISLSATQIKFQYTMGSASPSSQAISVSNSGGGTFTWSASSNISWLNLSFAPGVLTVSANPGTLSPNVYNATITVSATGTSNSPQLISVTLVVSAPPAPPTISLSASRVSFAHTVGSSAPSSQTVSITNSGGGNLTWTATSNVAWISTTPQGTAPSTLTISVNPNGLSANIYTGTITLTAAGASNNPQTISVKLTVSAVAPAIVVTSITNAASGVSGPIAPGEIITIKGSGLGPATGVSFSIDPATGMVDTTPLAGTTVWFGSIAAPITYTSAGQVNAIVPYEIAGQASVTVQVEYQSAASVGTSVQIASAAPGAFTLNGTGAGQAIAANQDYSFNGPLNPAAKESYVTIYFTGGGQTNPAGVTGGVTGAVQKNLVQKVLVSIGGVPATVSFSGAAPTLIDGVNQLNIQLASNTPSGAQQILITVGGVQSSATATLAVQ